MDVRPLIIASGSAPCNSETCCESWRPAGVVGGELGPGPPGPPRPPPGGGGPPAPGPPDPAAPIIPGGGGIGPPGPAGGPPAGAPPPAPAIFEISCRAIICAKAGFAV